MSVNRERIIFFGVTNFILFFLYLDSLADESMVQNGFETEGNIF